MSITDHWPPHFGWQLELKMEQMLPGN